MFPFVSPLVERQKIELKGDKEKMKTAVIYARYSSDNQTEQSIEGQLRVCNDYAKNNDILIVDTYIDRAMTGTNDNRPDFQRMIKDSSKRKWDYVLCYKFDRFSRNKYETAMHKKTLKDNGVKVISAMEYIPDSPEAIILESMLEGYAEYYSAELSQKIRRGNNESRRKGNLTGGHIPYGYINVNKKAVIHEDRAEIVRFIYEQYAKDVYVKDIIATLTEKGVLYNGKPFLRNTVYQILKNEHYSGIYHYNGEPFDNIYPQIVDTELFNKVRSKVMANKFGKKSETMTYLLRGKVICGYCGKSIIGENGTARNGERKYYYKCRGRKSGLGCTKQVIRKDVLEKIVLDRITQELSSPKRIDEMVKKLMQIQKQQSQNNAFLNVALAEEKQVKSSIHNILTAIENGNPSNTLTQRLSELEKRLEELQKQILIEKSKSVVLISESEIRKFYIQTLQLEPQMLITYLVKKIVLFDDKVQIHFNSPLCISSDNSYSQGFSFYAETVNISYQEPKRLTPTIICLAVEIQI